MPTHQKQAEEFILQKPNAATIDVCRAIGCAERTVERARASLKAKGKIGEFKREQPEPSIEEKVETRRTEAKIKLLQDQNKRLVSDYDKLMEQYDNALLIKERSKISIPKITFNTSVKNQATPILQWSDWHIEERIEKRITRGMNEYNPEVAERRADNLVANTLKIIKKERQDSTISEVVVCLGGDFINNFLHEHDVQMNFMHPIEAAIFAKTLLKKELSTLAEYGNFKRVVVICIRGNHGRLTKRMQSSNDYKMNLEAIIYYMLKQELNDSTFEFHIPESELGYIDVYNKHIRAFHGHQCKYQGGVGDLSIPLNKLIMKWDKTEKADWNLMHHFHRLMMPTNNTSLNGSLCGFNSYALSCGFQYEPPLQSFHLLDAKKGFTVRIPVFCE